MIGMMRGVDECYLEINREELIDPDFDMDDMIKLAKEMNRKEEDEL